MLILVLVLVFVLALVAWIYTGPYLSGPLAVVALGLWPAGIYSWFPGAMLAMVFMFWRWLTFCIDHDIETPWG